MGFPFGLKMKRAALFAGLILCISACSRTQGPMVSDLASSQAVAPVPLQRPASLSRNQAPSAKTVSSDTATKSCAFLADAKKIKNCMLAFTLVPNTQALIYSLAFMEANHRRLSDGSCVPANPGQGMTHDQLVNTGIRNTCQFVVNDVTSEYHEGSKKFPYRSNAYFIDLCGGPDNAVTHFYMNKGTGTNSKYLDVNGAKSTNLGAYLTGTSVVSFNPYDMSNAYSSIKKQNHGTIPALRLFGVQSTNNDSYKSKPLHISGYKSSWGCPSTGLQYQWMLGKLADGGPALVMNYGPSSFHPLSSINKCDAISENKVSPGVYHAKTKAAPTRQIAPIPMTPPPGLRSAGTS